MKKFLSLVLALVMTMSLVTIGASADFTDSSKITYKEAVDVVNAVKIVDGYADGSFNPTATLTRGAAAKIICNLILGPTTASALSADTAPYSDVPTTNTFAGYIAYCSSQGIISGYADGTFRPGASLTGYAFMKMLLGALGYNATTEKYVGSNWSIAVAKRALSIGLNKGLTDTFNGVKAVTREEAALYAFNTLKATMVEYDNSSTITVGDITITGSSTAKEMANTGTTDGNIKKDTKMQFAEKYFTNLKKTATTDAFSRPATNWKIKSESIGTYADAADLTYTEAVKVGTIYSDLGLSSGIAAAKTDVYEDGVTQATWNAYNIVKGGADKIGGNGALTEVFYNSDDASVVITVVQTYAGEVAAVRAATAGRDAYVTVKAKDSAAVYGAGDYETTASFTKGDNVLYTFSRQAGEGVQSVVAAPQVVTGTLKGFTANTNVIVDGTTYKANGRYSAAMTDTALNNAVKYEISVILDQYGYVVYFDTTAAEGNYAVVLDYDGSARIGTEYGVAKLLFMDGTTKTVALSNTVAAGGANVQTVNTFGSPFTTAAANAITKEDIVSYRINSANEYTLTLLADSQVANDMEGGSAANYNLTTKGSSDLKSAPLAAGFVVESYLTANTTNMKTGTTNPDQATYANGKTIFVVKNTANKYNVYTGVANVPTVVILATGAGATFTAYAKSVAGTATAAGAASVVYVDASAAANATISALKNDVVFVLGDNSGIKHNENNVAYYEYDAVVKGEVTTIKTAVQHTTLKMFDEVSYDKDGVATFGANVVHSSSATAGTMYYTTGTTAAKNGVIGMANKYYSYANDCKVFMVNADNDIVVSSIGAILDSTDTVSLFNIKDGDVNTIVYKEASTTGGVTVTDVYTVATKATVAIADTGDAFTATGAVLNKNGAAAGIADATAKVTVSYEKWTSGAGWAKFPDVEIAGSSVAANGAVTVGAYTIPGAPSAGDMYKVTLTIKGTTIGTLELFSGIVTVA